MIPYSRDPHQVIPASSVKIIGLGGAGANMLERIALDGMEGSELLALNTDIRTLGACLAREKIQLGVNLTKGLGTGGDPELGYQAVLEAEDQLREAIKGSRIVFLCTGLGGGTGSGAAPIVTRVAREEGAFVVVFATMPFAFEGRRRREQAETALNELAVLSNALVTFDNNRMGELVLAKQGIHEAFVAADHMICESIKAVIRLVIRPGLINVGLDDLMSALRTTRSRCLFGSGMASGKDRASKALRNALASPLLDQGALLKEAQTVLVHLCGGEDLTLFEIELLMQRLQKFVPEHAHVLFGAAIDPSMGDSLSLTLISALPEDSLAMAPRESISHASGDHPMMDPTTGFSSEPESEKPAPVHARPAPAPAEPPAKPAAKTTIPEPKPPVRIDIGSSISASPASKLTSEPPPASTLSSFRRSLAAATPTLFDEDRPFAEPESKASESEPSATPELALDPPKSSVIPQAPEDLGADEEREIDEIAATVAEFVSVAKEETSKSYVAAEPDPEPIEASTESEDFAEPSAPDLEAAGFSPIPRKRPPGVLPWARGAKSAVTAEMTDEKPEDDSDDPLADDLDEIDPEPARPATAAATSEPEAPRLKLGIKSATPQSELSLDSAPRGRFEGESPNVFEGEDLDLPPFLRKKK